VADSFGVALNLLLSGTPLIFLDVRNRPQLTETANRGALIDEAKAKYEETCDTYVQQGIADTFRVCAVAYFKDVLFFDGNSSTTDHKGSTTELVDENKSLIPLHEVIRIASAENEGDDGENKNLPEGGLKVATTHQIVSVATWLADRSARDGWEMMPTWKRDKEGANGKTYADFYHLRMQAMSTWCREFWTNPNFNVVNLCDQRGANRLVSHLVRLDRLPKSNPLEGLLLLRAAWTEYDVSMHLADRYKLISKTLFAFQLMMGWLVIVSTTLDQAPCESIAGEANDVCPHAFTDIQEGGGFAEIAFFLSAVAAVLISMDSLFNAQSRWRQLRSGAGSLESMIWCYRTRIGAFEIISIESRFPETAFRRSLVAWRDQLVAGGDLQVSSLGKKYHSDIYRHHQFPGSTPLVAGDDYYSPVQPKRYIEMRVKPLIDFFRTRIPRYVKRRYWLKCALLTCSLGATLLTRYRLSLWVIAMTSGAAAITSWQEFADIGTFPRVCVCVCQVITMYERVSSVPSNQSNPVFPLADCKEHDFFSLATCFISLCPQYQNSDQVQTSNLLTT
jgi:hypothetical protein